MAARENNTVQYTHTHTHTHPFNGPCLFFRLVTHGQTDTVP